jgi:hypothetical protein
MKECRRQYSGAQNYFFFYVWSRQAIPPLAAECCDWVGTAGCAVSDERVVQTSDSSL